MSLVSVEYNPVWYNKISNKVPNNVEYLLREKKDQYLTAINNYNSFDIIIIDGSYRYDCATEAMKNLSNHGFIILDNSDWANNASRFLRESDLIEVDMCGFGPINAYTWTTSFYFSRQVQLKPISNNQPSPGIGSLNQELE